MTRTRRNILIMSSGAILIGLAIFLLLRPKKSAFVPPSAPPEAKLPEAILPAPPTAPAAANLAPEERTEIQKQRSRELEARRVAQSFLERYGSFSNQGNFENISDLEPLMTVNMKKVAANYVREQKSLYPAEKGYYGITTRALTSALSAMSESRVIVTIGTQRQESAGSSETPRILYQEATLQLVKIGSVWKIDDVSWGSVK